MHLRPQRGADEPVAEEAAAGAAEPADVVVVAVPAGAGDEGQVDDFEARGGEKRCGLAQPTAELDHSGALPEPGQPAGQERALRSAGGEVAEVARGAGASGVRGPGSGGAPPPASSPAVTEYGVRSTAPPRTP